MRLQMTALRAPARLVRATKAGALPRFMMENSAIKLIASDMVVHCWTGEVPPETFELIEELYKRGTFTLSQLGRRYDYTALVV